MNQQERMMAALEQARMETAQQLVAEAEALMPLMQDASKQGIRDVSHLVPAWLANAADEAEQQDGPSIQDAFLRAYAQQHTTRLAEVKVPCGAHQSATGAALASQLGIDLTAFVEALWRGTSALYSRHSLAL